MAEPEPSDDLAVKRPTDPPTDPSVIELRYRYHRARRHARVERRREKRWARLRFWFVLGCLLLLALVIVVLILQQVQNIFGI